MVDSMNRGPEHRRQDVMVHNMGLYEQQSILAN